MEIRDSLTCHECGDQGAAPCAYVDRNSVRCQTLWCAPHAFTGTDGRPYCRRHIRLQAALQPDTPPPAWDNRAPALVVWIIQDVAPHLHRLLSDLTTPIQTIVLAEIQTETHGNGWEAGWTIVQEGRGSAITIFVSDDAPTMVNVRIGSQVIPLGEPPWIHYRVNQVVADVDEKLRSTYREKVLTTVTFAMTVANATMYEAAG